MKAAKIKIYLTILLIILTALFAPVPPAARKVTPDLIVMKRESITLGQALDESLARGDGRRVDWNSVRWEV